MILIAIALLAGQAQSQWTQTAGPEGGGIPALFRDGTDLYAGTYGNGGIFKSTDDGATWTQKIAGMGYQSVVAIDRSGSYLLASGTVGLYRSTDAGENWVAASGLPAGFGVYALLVDGATVYAGTQGRGIYVSTDNGATWSAANTNLPNSFGYTYAGGIVKAASGVLAAVTDNSTYGIYRSTDTGASWTKVDNGLPAFTQLNELTREGSVIYGGGPTVYKSTNDGVNWTESGTGITFGSGIDDIAASGSTMFAAGSNYLYRSSDAGASWTALGGGLPFMIMTSVVIGGPGVFAGTIAEGVYASTDNGDSWTRRVTGLKARDMTDFLQDGATLYGNGNGMFSTTDGGDSWQVIRGDLKDSSAQPGLIHVAGAEMYCRDFPAVGVERSTDGGASWNWSASGLPAFSSPTSMVSAGGNLFTVSSRIYRSADNGQTWVQADSMLGASVFLSNITKVNGMLFAYGQGVARSTDDGATWVRAESGIPAFFGVVGVTAVGPTLFTGGGFPVRNFKSTDNGDTWTPIATLPSNSSATQFLGLGNDLFACAENNGIYISANLGTSWTKISTGLPNTNYRYSLAIHDGWMYAGTSGNSVWKRPLSDVSGVVAVGGTVPAAFSLGNGYPNPFNPSTTIEFSVAATVPVTITVHDLLGRLVSVLAEGRFNPGTYRATWDADGASSGVYYVRMTAPSFVETRKLMLMR